MLREHVVELAVAILRYELSFPFSKSMAQVSALTRTVLWSRAQLWRSPGGGGDERRERCSSLESPHLYFLRSKVRIKVSGIKQQR